MNFIRYISRRPLDFVKNAFFKQTTRYTTLPKMGDESYMAMLNASNALSESLSQYATTNKAKSKAETFGNSDKTKWITTMTDQNYDEFEKASTASKLSQGISEFKEKLVSSSKDLAFYSEADFAFEFFLVPQKFNSFPSPQIFYETITRLDVEGCEVPSQVKLDKKSPDDFFEVLMDDSDDKEQDQVKRLHREWNELVSSQNMENSVFVIADKGSAYTYYFLTLFHGQSNTVFGLATAGIYT